VLTLSDIRKRFGATVALDGVTCAIEPGRVHALVGENGAGKSTLMNVLAGAMPPDDGAMTLGGEAYRPTSPLDARRHGIALIHQELSLCPHLTVAENILLGREPRTDIRFDRAEARRRAAAVLEPFHHPELHPDRRVADLPIAACQIVEICRAIADDAQVVLMDEPTSSLPREDVDRLFGLVRRLRARGVAVVYISHFLEEVRALADSVTVLRDGRTVWTGGIGDITDTQIIGHMVGRDVSELFPRRRPYSASAPEVLRVEHLSAPPAVHDVSLTVRRGEILGIAGLVGAGRTEFLRALMGLGDARAEGVVLVNGQPVDVRPPTPWVRLARGLGYVSEDRKGEGLTLPMSVGDNITCTRYESCSRYGVIASTAQRAQATTWMERLGVRARTPAQPVRTLSGGNQQKVALARLMHQRAQVWLLDEPTRGVDVGSKVQLYEAIAAAAAEGQGIVLVSSYLPELLGVCHSLAVMRRGTLSPTQPIEAWSPESVMAEAVGR
jgi:ribose transport system ATP-binding protein